MFPIQLFCEDIVAEKGQQSEKDTHISPNRVLVSLVFLYIHCCTQAHYLSNQASIILFHFSSFGGRRFSPCRTGKKRKKVNNGSSSYMSPFLDGRLMDAFQHRQEENNQIIIIMTSKIVRPIMNYTTCSYTFGNRLSTFIFPDCHRAAL